MAKVQNNLVIHGLSGMIGKQLVIRRQKNGGYVIGAAPKRNGSPEPTPAQAEQQRRFRDAILYAKRAHDNPEYKPLAESRGQSTFNVAMADFMHPPEIEKIDVSAYTGAIGQTITVTAQDDVKVASVGVLIATDEGVLVEKGSAAVSEQDPRQWAYTSTATAPSKSVKIVVDVADLAGQVTEETQHSS